MPRYNVGSSTLGYLQRGHFTRSLSETGMGIKLREPLNLGVERAVWYGIWLESQTKLGIVFAAAKI